MCYNELMKTKPLDVVYFVSAFPKNDLRYSIRSVAKNLEFNKLWIYGGKKYDINPDGYVRIMNQKGATKWDKVRSMYREVCLNDSITEDFIMFHDDFFIMKPIKEINPEHRGTFEAHISVIEASFGNQLTEYTKILRHASETLLEGNKSNLSYELHKPFIFNRKKLLYILDKYPREHCIRSIYGNYYQIGGEKTHDVKIFNKEPKFDYKKEPILSTDNSVITDGNEHWEYITNKFNERCKYEGL